MTRIQAQVEGMPITGLPMNRWHLLLFGFLGMLTLGLIYAWSVFVLPLEKEFGWDRDQTALTFSLVMTCFSLGSVAGGHLSVQRGPRLVATMAGMFTGAGLFLTSYVQTLLQLYAVYSLICGLSVGVVYNCIISTVTSWFSDRRGLASGVLMMGFGFGGLVLGVGASLLIDNLGWRTAFRVLGTGSLFIIVGLGQILRVPPSTCPDAGAAPHGEKLPVTRDYCWREAIRMPVFWRLWFWQMTILAGGLSTIAHIVPFAVERGIPTDLAVYALGCLSISNGIGRVTFGYLSDQLGRDRMMMIDSVMMMTVMLALATVLPFWGYTGLLAVSVAGGLAFGGTMPQASAVTAALFGQKHFGVNFGLVSTGLIVASLLGPYLLGRSNALANGYETGFFFLAAVAALGCISVMAIRRFLR